MASKRPHLDAQQYAEDSFSDDDDDQDLEYEQEQQHRQQQQQGLPAATRLGRSRRSSANSTGVALVGTTTATEQEMSPAQAAAIAANLPGSGAVKRRGRGPSKKAPLNRNALLARENRQRKKAYLKDIEDKLTKYHETNKTLSNIIEKQKEQLQDLTSQVNYYQSLVANQCEITTLLSALNEAMQALHGSKNTVTNSLSSKVAAALKNVNQNVDKFNWSTNPEEIASNPNSQSAPFSGIASNNRNPNELEGAVSGQQQPVSFGQTISPKIARKTLPLTNSMSIGTSSISTLPKTEDPSSVESLILDDNDVKFEQSPESHSYCEYNVMDMNSVGPGSSSNNQMPTTPLSDAMSNSLDLSDTDFEALSNVNVDNFMFDNVDKMNSPSNMQPDDQSHLLDEFFNSVNEKEPKLPPDEVDDLLGIDETSRFNRTLFNTLNPPTGICLHINSCRVSLEYCHLCYKRSLEKFNAS